MEGPDTQFTTTPKTVLTLEDTHTRFYQKGGFILCEPVNLIDERNLSSPEIQTETETFIQNGLMYDYKRTILDTGNKDYIYVMNYDGTIYTASMSNHSETQHDMHHSYFLKSKPDKSGYGIGKNVACAGHIKIRKGKVIFISNNSGHYQPNIDQLKIAAYSLLEKGILDTNVVIQSIGNESTGLRENILSLQDITNEKVRDILDQYPLAVKRTQGYVERRRAALNKLNENIRLFECPTSIGLLSSFLPDFHFPSQQGRFNFGVKELGNKKWRILFDNYNEYLPENIRNYPSHNFRFSSAEPEIITENNENGIEIKRIACRYGISSISPLLYPYPPHHKNFHFYLVPIIAGITTDFALSNLKDPNGNTPADALEMKHEVNQLDSHHAFDSKAPGVEIMRAQTYVSPLNLKGASILPELRNAVIKALEYQELRDLYGKLMGLDAQESTKYSKHIVEKDTSILPEIQNAIKEAQIKKIEIKGIDQLSGQLFALDSQEWKKYREKIEEKDTSILPELRNAVIKALEHQELRDLYGKLMGLDAQESTKYSKHIVEKDTSILPELQNAIREAQIKKIESKGIDQLSGQLFALDSQEWKKYESRIEEELKH